MLTVRLEVRLYTWQMIDWCPYEGLVTTSPKSDNNNHHLRGPDGSVRGSEGAKVKEGICKQKCVLRKTG